MKKTKKGQLALGDVPTIVRLLIIGGITLVIGLIVFFNFFTTVAVDSQADQCRWNASLGSYNTTNCNLEANMVLNMSSSLSNVSNNMPLIGTIVGLVVVLGIVLLIGAKRGGI